MNIKKLVLLSLGISLLVSNSFLLGMKKEEKAKKNRKQIEQRIKELKKEIDIHVLWMLELQRERDRLRAPEGLKKTIDGYDLLILKLETKKRELQLKAMKLKKVPEELKKEIDAHVLQMLELQTERDRLRAPEELEKVIDGYDLRILELETKKRELQLKQREFENLLKKR